MIKTFYSDISNGCMSEKREFYSESMSTNDIIEDLKKRRERLGQLKGFDGNKILIPVPMNNRPFTYRDVTEQVTDILSTEPDIDLWDIDIPCDIMIIRSTLKGVILSYPVADCPVVVVSSKDTLGIAYCRVDLVDKKLPISLVDAVSKVSKAKDSELSAYIGPCAGYNYIYESYPYWATSSDWKHFITDEYSGYRIDLKRAIMSQLMRRRVGNVTTSTIDTISDPNFYSDYASIHGAKTKKGKFLTGAYFDTKYKTR